MAAGAGGLLTASATIGAGERAVFVPITPCRWIDTRPTETVGSRSMPLGPGDTFITAARGAVGNCNIPAGAVGLVLNVAVVQPSGSSFLTVFPGDATRPLAASVNWIGGQPPLSNAVTTDIGGDGRVAFFNLAGTVHIAVDVVGYFEDHHHDDRYYTESEVDTRLAAKVDEPTGGEDIFVDLSEFRHTRALAMTEAFTHDVAAATIMVNSQQCLVAPVDLPDGVTVNAVTGFIADNNSTLAATVELWRRPSRLVGGPSQQMASASSVSATQQSVTDESISNPIVDAAEFEYLVQVCLHSNMTFFRLRIITTHPA
jgi:hypothetical protein